MKIENLARKAMKKCFQKEKSGSREFIGLPLLNIFAAIRLPAPRFIAA
jgi:hypothetical protein